MIVFLVNRSILNVMTEYLEHVKWYLEEKFSVRSQIISFVQPPAIPDSCTVVVFVQRVNDAIMRKINNNELVSTPPPAPEPRRSTSSFGVRRNIPTPPPPIVEKVGPPPPRRYKVYLFNTEQATVPFYVARTVDDVKKYQVDVIDYSLENIALLRNKLPNTKFIHMPYPFRPEPPTLKTGGVVGLLSSPHRKQVAATVKVPVTNFLGLWGAERDKIIRNSKVLLNVHFKPGMYGVFESIRCYQALELRTLVVSEPSVNSDLVLLKDYIIFSGLGTMESTVKDVLNNYQKYHDKYFSEERIAEIERLFEGVYKQVVEEILTGLNNREY